MDIPWIPDRPEHSRLRKRWRLGHRDPQPSAGAGATDVAGLTGFQVPREPATA